MAPLAAFVHNRQRTCEQYYEDNTHVSEYSDRIILYLRREATRGTMAYVCEVHARARTHVQQQQQQAVVASTAAHRKRERGRSSETARERQRGSEAAGRTAGQTAEAGARAGAGQRGRHTTTEAEAAGQCPPPKPPPADEGRRKSRGWRVHKRGAGRKSRV